jgi:GNAT superfamily N-acetyltransferase
VRGEELDREACGLLEAHLAGDVEQPHRIGECVVGVAPGVDHGDDAVAGLPADALPGFVDDARDLQTGDVRRLGAAVVVAPALHDVCEVDTRRLHVDADLARTGLRRLPLGHLEDVAVTERCDLDRLHTRETRLVAAKRGRFAPMGPRPGTGHSRSTPSTRGP